MRVVCSENDRCVPVSVGLHRSNSPLLKLYDDYVMERHYFSNFLMVTTGEVSKRVLMLIYLSEPHSARFCLQFASRKFVSELLVHILWD